MTDELLDLAVTAARAAGALLRGRCVEPRTGVGTKSSGTDMVSDADRAAEALIFSGIRDARPDDAILGEESGEAGGSTGLRWVVDPLDGTTNFLFGIPHWAVSIACEDGEGAILGVIYDALRDELFCARRGEGATLNDTPILASRKEDLGDALVATGFSYRPGEREMAARALGGIIARVRDVRRAGAASLDLAWVACGRLDGYYETPIEHWDVAAGTLLVTEAGGRTGSIPGIAGEGEGLVAAGSELFEGLRALVSKHLFA